MIIAKENNDDHGITYLTYQTPKSSPPFLQRGDWEIFLQLHRWHCSGIKTTINI